MSLEKFIPSTYTEIHGNGLHGDGPNDDIVAGYSKNYESKGKNIIKTVHEHLFSDATIEPAQPLPTQIPDETSRAGTSYFSSYLSSLEEYSKIRKGNPNAGPIGGCPGTGTGTTKRLHRPKSEPRLNLFSAASIEDSDGIFKPWLSSELSQCQRSRTRQHCVLDYDYAVVPSSISSAPKGLSASSSSCKENQKGVAEITALRHSSVDRRQDSCIRKPSEYSNGDDRERRKLEYSYLNHPHRSIIDVAGDDSYEAHYDRLNSSRARGPEGPEPGSGSGIGPGSRSGSGPESGIGSGPSSVQTSWGKKQTQRDRSSDAISAVMAHQYDNHNRLRKDLRGAEQQEDIREISKEKVGRLENRVLDHLSGHLGTLRHSLHRSDLSRSGEVSFDEFRSAVQQCGVDMTSTDLHEVFRGFADNTRSRGTANGHAVRSHDLRYFKDDVAINIDLFTEHLARRHEERSSRRGIEHGMEHSAEHQRALKKVLRACSKHADPESVLRNTHCVDPYSRSAGATGHSEGDLNVFEVLACVLFVH